jgi:hypothetical protein
VIHKLTKVWVVDKGTMLDTPKVRVGFVSQILPNSRYIITHEDGTEKLYPYANIFLSCRAANEYQVHLLGKRLNFLSPKVRKMEHTLTSMTT